MAKVQPQLSQSLAQMQKQIYDTVIKMTKDNASTLAEQSGVEPSLTDDEMES